MVNIKPNQNGMPADWRNPYSEFVRLQALAGKLGLNTNGWSLEAPSRTKKMFDPRWQMTYIDLASKRMITVYLGSNGDESAKTIHTTAEPYLKAVAMLKPKLKKAPPPDPMYNPTIVKKAFELWQSSLRARVPHREFVRLYPKQWALLSRKAGIYDIPLWKYLVNSPLSTVYPTPPRSDQEVKNRKREIEEMERQRRRDDTAYWGEYSSLEEWKAAHPAPPPPRDPNYKPPAVTITAEGIVPQPDNTYPKDHPFRWENIQKQRNEE